MLPPRARFACHFPAQRSGPTRPGELALPSAGIQAPLQSDPSLFPHFISLLFLFLNTPFSQKALSGWALEESPAFSFTPLLSWASRLWGAPHLLSPFTTSRPSRPYPSPASSESEHVGEHGWELHEWDRVLALSQPPCGDWKVAFKLSGPQFLDQLSVGLHLRLSNVLTIVLSSSRPLLLFQSLAHHFPTRQRHSRSAWNKGRWLGACFPSSCPPWQFLGHLRHLQNEAGRRQANFSHSYTAP